MRSGPPSAPTSPRRRGGGRSSERPRPRLRLRPHVRRARGRTTRNPRGRRAGRCRPRALSGSRASRPRPHARSRRRPTSVRRACPPRARDRVGEASPPRTARPDSLRRSGTSLGPGAGARRSISVATRERGPCPIFSAPTSLSTAHSSPRSPRTRIAALENAGSGSSTRGRTSRGVEGWPALARRVTAVMRRHFPSSVRGRPPARRTRRTASRSRSSVARSARRRS